MSAPQPIRNLPSGLLIESLVTLAPLTSWGVGGRADHLVQPKTVQDLKESLGYARIMGLPVTILGGGTNVLVSDRGVRGLTIALRKMAGAKVSETVGSDGSKHLKLDCLSGTSKSELLKTFLKHRLEPALFLAGLPGDVGGGVVMNAGVGEMIRPREFTEITEWVEVLRWNEAKADEILGTFSSAINSDQTISNAIAALAAEGFTDTRINSQDLQWSYRHCEGWRPGVITRAGLSWPLEPKDDILPRVKQANQTRLQKQPLDMPSCGSVFVNPEGHKSGQLIESCGLKGYKSGGAKVSEKHANFIVNFDSAKAIDVHNVIEHVKAAVHAKTGVVLKTEVVYLGDW